VFVLFSLRWYFTQRVAKRWFLLEGRVSRGGKEKRRALRGGASRKGAEEAKQDGFRAEGRRKGDVDFRSASGCGLAMSDLRFLRVGKSARFAAGALGAAVGCVGLVSRLTCVLAGEAALEGFGEFVDLRVLAAKKEVVAVEEFELEGEAGEGGRVGAEDRPEEGGVGVWEVEAAFLVCFVAVGGDAGAGFDLFRSKAEGAAAVFEEEVLHRDEGF
jgi:hypothetical protein